jgi:hypothetical protein
MNVHDLFSYPFPLNCSLVISTFSLILTGKRSSSVGSEKLEIDRDKWRGIVQQAKAHSGL